MSKPRTPKIFPQVLENGNERRGDKMFFIVAFRFKDIDSNGERCVRGIEIDDLVRAFLWYEVQQIFYQIAVRVYKCDAMSQTHILYHHILNECGLARSCLADDIQMMSAIRLFDTERFQLLSESGLSEEFQFVHFVNAQTKTKRRGNTSLCRNPILCLNIHSVPRILGEIPGNRIKCVSPHSLRPKHQR